MPTKENKVVTHGVGKQGQTVTFNTVKDHIVYYVQKSYPFGLDIATSLRDKDLFDLGTVKPTRPVSKEKVDGNQNFEQDGIDIKYTANMKEHVERK